MLCKSETAGGNFLSGVIPAVKQTMSQGREMVWTAFVYKVLLPRYNEKKQEQVTVVQMAIIMAI